MKDLIDTITQLKARGDLVALWAYLRLVVVDLLNRGELRHAFILATMLAKTGNRDPLVSAALALGGMVFSRPDEERAGMEALRAQADALSEIQQEDLYRTLLPVVEKALGPSPHPRDYSDAHQAQILRKGEIYRAASPFLRAMLDQDAPVPVLSLEKMRQKYEEHPVMINNPLPPADAPHSPRRVLVAMRERTLFGRPPPGQPARAADYGLRIAMAMREYGWQTERHDFRVSDMSQVREDCQSIVERCRQLQTELLVIDLNVLGGLEGVQISTQMITQLRRENPSIRVLACAIDATFLTNTLIDLAPHLDLVWSSVEPSLPVWKHPALDGKVLLTVPLPPAGNTFTPDIPLIPEMLFAGTASVTINRILWLTTAERIGLPIRKRLSSQYTDDGLPPLESYALYIKSIRDATCILNFSMRAFPPPTYYVNGRTFEGILAGALLIQETAPETYHYFIPGEHFLEFATLAELRSIVRFITENRDEAEEVRRRGNAFAREHYNDTALIGYIDKRLYFPDLQHHRGSAPASCRGDNLP
ncbi:MAG: glycosyltransferase [Magnetococcus sp. MYC-9]